MHRLYRRLCLPKRNGAKNLILQPEFLVSGIARDHSAGFLKRLDCITIYQTRLFTHVQYTQTDTIRQTNGPLVPVVRLVPIETLRISF